MNPDLPPLTQTDWFRDFEGREWVARMDDHFSRGMRELAREFEAGRSETVQRAVWGTPDHQPGTVRIKP